MTIFTVNVLNDNYLDKPFHKFCISTWKKSGFPVKIFNYNSDEVKEAKEKYKTWIKSALNSSLENKVAIAYDPIRLYILSLYEDMMYFDADIIVMKSKALSKIAEEKHFSIYGGGNFFCIHNGKDLETPKKILDRCYTSNCIAGDNSIISKLDDLKLQKMKHNYEFMHNPRIDNPSWHCRWTDNTKEVTENTDDKYCFYLSDKTMFKEAKRNSEFSTVKSISDMSFEDRKIFKTFLENGNDYDSI